MSNGNASAADGCWFQTFPCCAPRAGSSGPKRSRSRVPQHTTSSSFPGASVGGANASSRGKNPFAVDFALDTITYRSVEWKNNTQKSTRRTVAFAAMPDEDAGSSMPVLVFHPNGASRRILALLADDARSASLRLVCVNRPGQHGTSPARSSRSFGTTAVADAAEVLDRLEIRQAGILCISSGAVLAFAFAAMRPDRTAGLVVGSGCWFPPQQPPKAATVPPYLGVEDIAAALVFKRGRDRLPTVESIREGLLQNENPTFDAVVGRDEVDRNGWLHRLHWTLQESSEGLHQDAAGICRMDTREVARGVRAMVRLYHGLADEVMPVGFVEGLAREMAKAQVVHLAGVSHTGTSLLLPPTIRSEGLMLLGQQMSGQGVEMSMATSPAFSDRRPRDSGSGSGSGGGVPHAEPLNLGIGGGKSIEDELAAFDKMLEDHQDDPRVVYGGDPETAAAFQQFHQRPDAFAPPRRGGGGGGGDKGPGRRPPQSQESLQLAEFDALLAAEQARDETTQAVQELEESMGFSSDNGSQRDSGLKFEGRRDRVIIEPATPKGH